MIAEKNDAFPECLQESTHANSIQFDLALLFRRLLAYLAKLRIPNIFHCLSQPAFSLTKKNYREFWKIIPNYQVQLPAVVITRSISHATLC